MEQKDASIPSFYLLVSEFSETGLTAVVEICSWSTKHPNAWISWTKMPRKSDAALWPWQGVKLFPCYPRTMKGEAGSVPLNRAALAARGYRTLSQSRSVPPANERCG